jgi:hypothetical protein
VAAPSLDSVSTLKGAKLGFVFDHACGENASLFVAVSYASTDDMLVQHVSFDGIDLERVSFTDAAARWPRKSGA